MASLELMPLGMNDWPGTVSSQALYEKLLGVVTDGVPPAHLSVRVRDALYELTEATISKIIELDGPDAVEDYEPFDDEDWYRDR